MKEMIIYLVAKAYRLEMKGEIKQEIEGSKKNRLLWMRLCKNRGKSLISIIRKYKRAWAVEIPCHERTHDTQWIRNSD